MRITTNRKAALGDRTNRAEALSQLRRDDKDFLILMSADDVEQSIDDVINEWVDELKHDLESGLIL